MISFKANLIYNDRKVTKYDFNKTTQDHPVSFVRVIPTDEKDILALQKTKDLWKKTTFASTIFDRALGMFYDEIDPEDREIFLLTEQNSDFENLVAEKILAMGLVMTRSKFSKYITYLQTNPNYMFQNRQNCLSGLKGIGTEFLECCKLKFKDFLLILNATKDSEQFYLKNGFNMINKDTRYMSFTKKLK